MRKINTAIVALILLTALGVSSDVCGLAQAPKTDTPETGSPKAKRKPGADSEKRAKQAPFRGVLGSVDKVNKSITIKGKAKNRTFQITSSTRLTKDGKPAVLDDAVVGDQVAGTWRESADGKQEAVMVRLGAKAPAEPKPKKEKKEKEEK